MRSKRARVLKKKKKKKKKIKFPFTAINYLTETFSFIVFAAEKYANLRHKFTSKRKKKNRKSELVRVKQFALLGV